MKKIMDRIIKIFVICLLSSIIYACEDDKTSEDMAPYFGISGAETEQTFVGEPDVKYVTVITNREFSVTSSEPSWCSVEMIDDKVDNIKISVTKNEKNVDRSAKITVSSQGFSDIVINVTQNWIASITTDKSYVLLNNDNLEFTLKITSSIAYEIETPDWVEEVGEQTNGVHTFKTTAISPSERSGNIIIKSTDEAYDTKATVSVVQRERIKKIASWLFDDAQNLVKATIGEDLQMVRNTDYNPDAQFLSVEGPASGNKAVRIPVNCHFLADHGMIPKANESYISEYTLFFEFKIPAVGRFYSFYQTNLENTGDAEIFIRSAIPPTIGVGATGYAGENLILAETWHRLYLSFKPGDVKFFIDGVQFLSSTTSDSRFRMDLNGVILCGGPWTKKDDNEFDIAEISIWNGALTADQVKELEGIEE